MQLTKNKNLTTKLSKVCLIIEQIVPNTYFAWNVAVVDCKKNRFQNVSLMSAT